ncbi:MAG TPA: cobyric acid synthase [Acidimicrobiales bacterium]|nr:cobyric acid synthase [Acidimicrobiales bacterium]
MTDYRPLMVLGCTSTAGKSLLVTALARWFSRQGIDVAPFKAQNMSNNARVVDGGEIGVAQWLQARAAGLEPTVDMNPVLLKPEADTRSQVVVSGVARRDLTELPWRERAPYLWPAMTDAYERVAGQHELVLLEGAGSPAEINLPDLVNNRMLQHADASAVVVVDIDRGGAFAHLYGTWSLAPPETRSRMAAYILNKFRGDAALLEPGPAMLTERTGMAMAAVLPMLEHDLPDEEGGTIRATPPAGAQTVAVVRYPYASNLDELRMVPHAARMHWATDPSDLDGADLVVLPGSKHVAADAAWLRRQHLDARLRAFARAGGRVLGLCGGAMLLGTDVRDATGVEGATTGLGLLPLGTEMSPEKLTRRRTVEFPALDPPWSALSGLRASGYEIRNGTVRAAGCEVAPLVWRQGSVLATTVHGLLEDPEVLRALCGIRVRDPLEDTFDLLADAVEDHVDTGLLQRLTMAP